MDQLRAREINLEGVKVIVIETVGMRVRHANDYGFIHGSLEPLAVIICDRKGTRARDMGGNPTSLVDLARAVPQLEAMIGAETDR
jgi:hypothetical protein